MAEESVPDQKSSGPKYTRGAFPRMSFNKTVELVKAVYDLGHGDPIRRVSVFNHLNRSADSGPSRQQVTAANSGYGLLIGGPQAPNLQPSERGKALVRASGQVERERIAYDALMENAIFRAFIERYKDRPLPNDEVLGDYLKDTFGLNQSDAKQCAAVIKENLRDHDLIEPGAGGRETVLAPDTALANKGEIPLTDKRAGEVRSSAVSAPHPSATGLRQSARVSSGQTLPQIAFNIQIQLPGDATPETYEAIFKNIATHLLGRGEE